MNFSEIIHAARESRDYSRLGQAIPYMETLGLTVEEQDGGVVLLLAAAELHVGNPWKQALHGGLIGAVLETAAIVQLVLEPDVETLPKPINITVDYLRSGRVTPTRAEARVTKLGRRVANVYASCWQDDKARPIATLSGHFLMT
jgi:uncharacterized protein (TIGR00369 family)